MESNFRHEAEVFGKYLLKEPPDNKSVMLYVSAMEKMNISLSQKETNLLSFMMKNPRSMGIIDSALAVFDRNSNVRRKLFVMLAILEVSTAYTEKFLPRKTGPLYSLHVIFSGFRSVAKSFIGFFVIKFI